MNDREALIKLLDHHDKAAKNGKCDIADSIRAHLRKESTPSGVPVEGLRVIGRVCKCGHPESDHEGDCAYGWTGEPGEEACDCTGFVLDSEEVAPALATPAEPPVESGLDALVVAAREQHGPMCAACGGFWNDEHYAEWGDRIRCLCSRPYCHIGAALARLAAVPEGEQH